MADQDAPPKARREGAPRKVWPSESEPIVPIEGTGRFKPWAGRRTLPERIDAPRRRKRGEGVTLRAVRPNVGFEIAYRRRLAALVAQMHEDVQRSIALAYQGHAADAAPPASLMVGVMRRLSRRWLANFDALSQELAAYFAQGVADRADGALEAILRRGGFEVGFRLTPEVRDALQAITAENVSLIKSIGSEYLTQIEGHVMRAAAAGRDLAPLAQTLEHQYGVTRRRAALIARDQTNKATAAIVRERQNELDIKAIWIHSGGGKHPRPSHVANDGKEYDPKIGWYDPDARQRVWPGTLINCRCVSRSLIPGLT